jgi:hypothetical protein
MLYLLAGAPRSGKSTIARRFVQETGIPCFSLDFLMMGFARGLPEYGVDPEDDEWTVAELLWPVVKGMAATVVEEQVDYLMEGVQLQPKHVWELCEELGGEVRSCFVGFAELGTMTKFQELRAFGGGPDDWLWDLGDRELLREIERLRAFSTRLRNECSKYGLKYFEATGDLQRTVDAVVQYLKGPIAPGPAMMAAERRHSAVDEQGCAYEGHGRKGSEEAGIAACSM